jgi:hypothetical protein
MQTVVETKPFSRGADQILQPDERLDLVAYLATNPLAGDVIERRRSGDLLHL